MNDIETLIAARAAAMADHDGVGVQVVHIFGAANQLTAELGSARDRLIGRPGLLADTLSDLANAETADIDAVEAARKAADDAQTAALEAAARADELTAKADQLQAEREAEEQAEAERLAAEQAAAEAAADAEKAAAEAAEQAAAEAAAAAATDGKPARKAK